MATKGSINKGDYRPTNEGKNAKHSKPIFNAADYRPGFGFGEGKGSGGKGGGKKKAKIFHYSHRIAPGATRDPWGNVGR